MSWKQRLLWLAIRLSLFAASASAKNCSSGGKVTIESQADADVLSKCDRFRGDVDISPSALGNITLDGLLSIDGSLRATLPGDSDAAEQPVLLGLSSETLAYISGDLVVSSVASLQSITLPKLRTVGGAVDLSHLGALVDLHLEGINSVGNFSLVSAPNLRHMSIGEESITIGPDLGLKHITSETNPAVVVRDVGIEDLSGLLDIYNASLVELADLPNLNSALIVTGHVGEVRIRGNGNLTLHMFERGGAGLAIGSPQPVIGKLDISGVKHVSPCLWPDVHEFVAVNNPVEFLRFGFKAVRRLEIRDNPRMKTLVPWNGNNLWQWDLEDLLITDNPLLVLSRFPVRSPADNLTLPDCPYMFNHSTDEWKWYPFHMNTLVIDAAIDYTFLQSFTDLWEGVAKPVKDTQSLGMVLKNFTVSSTDPFFSCSELDVLRSQKGAFPGAYSCQGHTLAAAHVPGSAASGLRAVSGRLPLAVAGALIALCLP